MNWYFWKLGADPLLLHVAPQRTVLSRFLLDASLVSAWVPRQGFEVVVLQLSFEDFLDAQVSAMHSGE